LPGRPRRTLSVPSPCSPVQDYTAPLPVSLHAPKTCHARIVCTKLCVRTDEFHFASGLGAGGGRTSSTQVADISNSSLYGVYTVVAFFAGSFLNIIGPRISLTVSGSNTAQICVNASIAERKKTDLAYLHNRLAPLDTQCTRRVCGITMLPAMKSSPSWVVSFSVSLLVCSGQQPVSLLLFFFVHSC
jgi:hypothetical protein